jgi:hypothetical protein
MAQSTGVDSTDRSFAIFVNSNQSEIKSNTKNYVRVPFQGNLSDHDPNKIMQVSLTGMHFTNTIYNITEENNRLRMLIYWAAGRGHPETANVVEIVIPTGFYTIDTLASYLSKQDILSIEKVQQRFEYAQGSSYNNIYGGFGVNPADPSDPIVTPAAKLNSSGTKIIFQSPDFSHLIQYGVDVNTVPLNYESFTFLDNTQCSFIYKGIYIEYPINDITYQPLLRLLGLLTDTNQGRSSSLRIPSDVLGRRYGFGVEFSYEVVAPAVPNPINTAVYYFPKNSDGSLINSVLETPKNFHGLIYQDNSVILTCCYEYNPADPKVIELDNGSFINGTNISVPSPYIVSFSDCYFTGTFTNGSNTVTGINVISGTLSVGMSIGIKYGTDPNDPLTYLVPVDTVKAANFNYAAGSVTPGFENTRAYYITAVINSTTALLNKEYVGTTLSTGTGNGLGSMYILTTPQNIFSSGISENLIASPASITELSAEVTPDNVTNLSGADEIHLHCAQLRTDNFSSTDFGPLAPSDVIAVIPIEAGFGAKQFYQPPNPITSFLNNTNITSLEIELTDARGDPLNFNGVDWSLTLFCTESDAASPEALSAGGTFNTPFQDQLAALEGTAQAEVKRKRQIIFQESHKSGRHSHGIRY